MPKILRKKLEVQRYDCLVACIMNTYIHVAVVKNKSKQKGVRQLSVAPVLTPQSGECWESPR